MTLDGHFLTAKSLFGTTLEDLKSLYQTYQELPLHEYLRNPTEYQKGKQKKHTGTIWAYEPNISKFFPDINQRELDEKTVLEGTYSLDNRGRLCTTFDFGKGIGQLRQESLDLGTQCNINKVVLLSNPNKLHSFPIPSTEGYDVLFLPKLLEGWK